MSSHTAEAVGALDTVPRSLEKTRQSPRPRAERTMTLTHTRPKIPPLRTLLALVAALSLAGSGAFGQSVNSDRPWLTYGGDLKNIGADGPAIKSTHQTSTKLRLQWRFKTDNLGNRPEYKRKELLLWPTAFFMPRAGTRRAVVALDAATGELLWVHGEREGERGANAPRGLSGRGLAYWTDGKEERILYTTPGYRLIALDAKTGAYAPRIRGPRSRRSQAR